MTKFPSLLLYNVRLPYVITLTYVQGIRFERQLAPKQKTRNEVPTDAYSFGAALVKVKRHFWFVQTINKRTDEVKSWSYRWHENFDNRWRKALYALQALSFYSQLFCSSLRLRLLRKFHARRAKKTIRSLYSSIRRSWIKIYINGSKDQAVE